MNIKSIHYAMHEFSLLTDIGMSVVQAYETMIVAHVDDPDVHALFKDLRLEASGTADTYDAVQDKWDRYTKSYESLPIRT